MVKEQVKGVPGGPAQTVHRNRRIGLVLEPSVWDRLIVIGKRIGVPPSTLAAAAIGSYVANTEASLSIGKSIAEGFLNLIQAEMSKPENEAVSAQVLEAFQQRLFSAHNPAFVDSEGAGEVLEKDTPPA